MWFSKAVLSRLCIFSLTRYSRTTERETDFLCLNERGVQKTIIRLNKEFKRAEKNQSEKNREFRKPKIKKASNVTVENHTIAPHPTCHFES